jgi:hypothetical protein
MEHFTHFLRGRHFALYTDHKPVVNLRAVHTKALSQIQEVMLKYDFEIIYQKGSEMPENFHSQNVVSQLSQNRINSLQFENQTGTKQGTLDQGDQGLDDDRIRMQNANSNLLHEKLLE